MYRWYGVALAARSRVKPCIRALNSSCLLQNSSSSRSLPPIFYTPHLQFATGRRHPPKKAEDDDDDDFDDDDDDEYEFENVDDPSGYEFDYETWNLLHQGKKENEASRKLPLPMYKAREMVDYHMIKNRVDGLKVITDPKLEYELRKQLHEGLVDFYRKIQIAFDEIDAAAERKIQQEAVETSQKKETLQVAGGETLADGEALEGESLQVESKDKETESSQEMEASSEDGKAAEIQSHEDQEGSPAVVEAEEVSVEKKGVELHNVSEMEASSEDGKAAEMQSHEDQEGSPAMVKAEEVSVEKKNVELQDVSEVSSVVDDIIKDVLTVPDVTSLHPEGAMEARDGAKDDEVNVFNYDKWVAYKEEEMAKRYAEQEKRKLATLRWKIQLVLGPGDVWHPANRKASVSVYVRELGLSKYSKQRLLALVGNRYKSPKDELTIVSERYQHRYENQKDVLRTLLDLIEEAKKADKLVNDARVEFFKGKNLESKATETGVAATA